MTYKEKIKEIFGVKDDSKLKDFKIRADIAVSLQETVEKEKHKCQKSQRYRRLEFEDKGQDLLYFVINDKDVVVEAGPFQNRLFQNCVLIEEPKINECPVFLTPQEESRKMIYKVTAIKTATFLS